MKQHTIIGMAGHIDHGKTALIRALTGIETDRLPEEKKRGITIDIGFAYWKQDVTIIDVPGHEKFVHNMVAGVSTVDFFLLVVAADDGIMPQTREHFDVLKFFGVRDGIVALNKIDLVDEEWRDLVLADIEEFLQKQGYSHIPVIPVSAVTGAGVDRLRELVLEKIGRHRQHRGERPFRLNVDRHFVLHGFGDVVTGTVLSGRVAAGQKILQLPDRIEGRVRGIQVHQKETDAAQAGQRAAVNLTGFKPNQLQRGAVLVEPDSLETTNELLAVVHTTDYFKFKPRRHSEMRVHVGTAEYRARVDWYQPDSFLVPGKNYRLRLKSKQPIVAAPGDAILLRSLSPVITVAGGRVLMIDPPKIKKNDARWEEIFDGLESGDLSAALKIRFDYSEPRAFEQKELERKHFFDAGRMTSELERLVREKTIVKMEQENRTLFLSRKKLNEVIGAVVEVLDQTVRQQPHQPGLNFNELFNKLKRLRVQPLFLQLALQRALNQQKIFLADDRFYSQAAKDLLNANEQEQRIEEIYRKAEFQPPTPDELAKTIASDVREVKSLLVRLARSRKLVSVGGKFYLHARTFDHLLEFLQEHFERQETLDVQVLREFTGASRKYLIPLLEHLDLEGYTQRDGDVRRRGYKL